MSRLGIRFALEALFILAVAVAVGFAHLEAKWIVLVMVGAWLLCALVELIAAKPQFLRDWRRYFVRPPTPATAGGPPGPEPIAAVPVAPEATPQVAVPPPVAPPSPPPEPPPPEPKPPAEAPAPPAPVAGAAAAGAAAGAAAAAPKKPSLWKRLTAP